MIRSTNKERREDMDKLSKLPLRALRANIGFTQEQVADAIGVNRNTYANWEKYITFPDVPQLLLLSRLFKCSLDAFYFPEKTSLKLVNQGKEAVR